jgi:hypothetical protein
MLAILLCFGNRVPKVSVLFLACNCAVGGFMSSAVDVRRSQPGCALLPVRYVHVIQSKDARPTSILVRACGAIHSNWCRMLTHIRHLSTLGTSFDLLLTCHILKSHTGAAPESGPDILKCPGILRSSPTLVTRYVCTVHAFFEDQALERSCTRPCMYGV